jgi:hypothetical protein
MLGSIQTRRRDGEASSTRPAPSRPQTEVDGTGRRWGGMAKEAHTLTAHLHGETQSCLQNSKPVQTT